MEFYLSSIQFKVCSIENYISLLHLKIRVGMKKIKFKCKINVNVFMVITIKTYPQLYLSLIHCICINISSNNLYMSSNVK